YWPAPAYAQWRTGLCTPVVPACQRCDPASVADGRPGLLADNPSHCCCRCHPLVLNGEWHGPVVGVSPVHFPVFPAPRCRCPALPPVVCALNCAACLWAGG